MNIPPDLAKYAAPEVPVPQRLMAARGLVPLKPEQQVTLYYLLAQAPEEQVAQTARKSATEMPANLLKAALSKSADPDVLDFYAASLTDEGVLEVVVTNPRVSNNTLIRVARGCTRYVQQILVQNQQRLMAAPEITDALLANASLGTDLRAQIEEFRKGFLGLGDDGASAEGVATQPTTPAGAAAEGIELIEAEDIGLAAVDEIDEEDDFPEELLAEVPAGAGDEEAGTKDIQALIAGMTVSQKVKLATLGNKTARGYLVRESNRLVATAVLRSPRITEDEIEEISRNRNVDQQVLRIIASNKSWMKLYAIKRNLVENSKTPLEISMRMVNQLNEKDIKGLSKNKNVPQGIRNAARRIIQAKEEAERRKREKGKH